MVDESDEERKRELAVIRDSLDSLRNLFCMEKIQQIVNSCKEFDTDRKALSRQKQSLTLADIRSDLDISSASSRTQIKQMLCNLDFRVVRMIDWHVIIHLRDKLRCDKRTGMLSSLGVTRTPI